jgi:hypothetical protein
LDKDLENYLNQDPNYQKSKLDQELDAYNSERGAASADVQMTDQ